MMKQSALAQLIGVSQPAIARWERGLDMPAPANLKRLQALMAGTLREELALDRLFIDRQAGMRALFDCDGVRLVATSQGLRNAWPTFSELIGVPLIDCLVGEVAYLTQDETLGRALRDGSLGLVSGVSRRHADLQIDMAIHHRWHICLRRHGVRMLADIVYEPCAADIPEGITDIVYLDAIDRPSVQAAAPNVIRSSR